MSGCADTLQCHLKSRINIPSGKVCSLPRSGPLCRDHDLYPLDLSSQKWLLTGQHKCSSNICLLWDPIHIHPITPSLVSPTPPNTCQDLRCLPNFPLAISWLSMQVNAGLVKTVVLLFVVMLPKAHLTWHSRVSGSRRLTTRSWLSESLRPFFLYSSSVFSWHLFLIACASVRFLPFLSFIGPSLYEIFPWYCQFSWKDLVFPVVLLSSISLHCSLKKAFLSLLEILWNSAFSWVSLSLSPLPFASLFSAVCKAASDNYFTFLLFFFLRMVLVPTSCTMLWTSIHSSSGSLSTTSNPLNLFVTSTV